jgi:phage shock protein PspC (stress-responsive transcriptional regulator)
MAVIERNTQKWKGIAGELYEKYNVQPEILRLIVIMSSVITQIIIVFGYTFYIFFFIVFGLLDLSDPENYKYIIYMVGPAVVMYGLFLLLQYYLFFGHGAYLQKFKGQPWEVKDASEAVSFYLFNLLLPVGIVAFIVYEFDLINVIL